jgi:hypothetical protein
MGDRRPLPEQSYLTREAVGLRTPRRGDCVGRLLGRLEDPLHVRQPRDDEPDDNTPGKD